MVSLGLIRLFGMAFGLINTSLIARLGNAELLGRYAFWTVGLGWAVAIGEFGVSSWLIRQVANKKMDLYGFFKISCFILVLTIVSATFFYLFLIDRVSEGIGEKNIILFFVFISTSIFNVFKVAFVSVNRGAGKAAIAEVSEGIVHRLAVFLSLLVIAIKDEPLELKYILFAALCGAFLSVLLPLAYAVPFLQKNRNRASFHIKDIFPFYGVSLSNMFAQRVDMLILGIFTAPDVVGFYRVADSIMRALSIVHEAAKKSIIGILPRWSTNEEERDSLRLKVKQVVSLSSSGTLLGLIFLFVFGRKVLELFWGPEFVKAFPILLILVFSKTVSTFAGPVGMAAVLNGLEKESNIIFWVAAVLNAACSLASVHFLGGIGVALGTLISNLVFNSFLLYFLKRRLDFNTTAFF